MIKFSHFLINKKKFVLSIILTILIISVIYTIKSTNHFLTGIGDIKNSDSNYVKETIDKNFNQDFSYNLIITTNKNLSDNNKNQLIKLLQNEDKIQSIYSKDNNYFLADILDKKSNLTLIINLKNNSFKDYEDYVPILRNKIKNQIVNSNESIFITGNSAFSFDMNYLSESQGRQAEINVFIITLIVLFFAFSSISGALIAVGSGFISAIITISILKFISGFYELSIFSQNISTMLGLGLSIDYSLLMISRYRKESLIHDSHLALINTLLSAGKSVIYSGLTVIIGFTVLFIPNLNLAYSIGLGGSIVTFFSVITALTFTPIALIFSRKYLKPNLKLVENKKTNWEKWGNYLYKNPIKLTFLSLSFLILTAIPVLNLKLSEPDIRSMPDIMESKKGFIELEKTGKSDLFYPFQIIIESKSDIKVDTELYNFLLQLKKYPFEKIYTVLGELNSNNYTNYFFLKNSGLGDNLFNQLENNLLSKTKKQTMVIAFPHKNLKSYQLNETIKSLKIIKDKNFKIYIGGNTALGFDLINQLYKYFPLMIFIVYLFTAIILYYSYKSILIPIKAIIVNTFSVLSCYGIMVIIFQYGYFNSLINLKYSPESIISGLPVILFCIMFSLSMDYEVFLLSSIYEDYKVSGDNKKAVIMGLSNTSGIITKAALVMIIVFSAFIQADIILIKMLGTGLAIAIIIDSTIIRLILVPCLMSLAGNYNWKNIKDIQNTIIKTKK